MNYGYGVYERFIHRSPERSQEPYVLLREVRENLRVKMVKMFWGPNKCLFYVTIKLHNICIIY